MAKARAELTTESLVRKLRGLRQAREMAKRSAGRSSRARAALTPAERRHVLAKTGGRCHICGGTIIGGWNADHVNPHSGGGEDEPDNFLPAHPVCNHYRWDYLPEEYQEIVRLGVWLRTQVEKQTKIGLAAASRHVAYERALVRRGSGGGQGRGPS